MKVKWGSILIGSIAVAIATTAMAAVQVNDKTEVAISVFVPCAAGGAGEVVDLSGTLHTLVSATVNANSASGYFHFQPDGISGVGETTGTVYHATGVTLQSFKTALQNGQGSQTYVNNFRIIGDGPGNNYLVHETLHITFNAGGNVTVSFDDLRIDCK